MTRPLPPGPFLSNELHCRFCGGQLDASMNRGFGPEHVTWRGCWLWRWLRAKRAIYGAAYEARMLAVQWLIETALRIAPPSEEGERFARAVLTWTKDEIERKHFRSGGR